MTTVLRAFPTAKPKVSVSAIQLIPGALSSTLPLFALENDTTASTLFLRADDANICGVYLGNLQQVPVVEKSSIQTPSNQGCNFYSATWCIHTLSARYCGKRTEIQVIDSSVYTYLTTLYSLIGTVPISLTGWRLESTGYVKTYQILQGSSYITINGTTYMGAAAQPKTQISGESTFQQVLEPLLSDDFTFNGANITTIQMPYNTFCAIDTPITISAIDSSNPTAERIYFTLANQVTMNNSPSGL